MAELEKGKAGGKQLGTSSPPNLNHAVEVLKTRNGVFAHSAGAVKVVVRGKYTVGMKDIITKRDR